MCVVGVIILLGALAYAFYVNFTVYYHFKKRVASCLVEKDNIIKRLLIGGFRLVFNSFIFAIIFSSAILNFAIDLNPSLLVFMLINAILMAVFYKKYWNKIREISSAVASDYIFTFWLPIIVAISTSIPYAVYLLYTTPVKEVIPTTNVLDYISSVLNSELVKNCQILGIPAVFIKLMDYLAWVLILGSKKINSLLAIAAAIVWLAKNSIEIWSFNRVIVGSLIIFDKNKEVKND